MMPDEKNFGYSYFTKLNENQYLRTLYHDILFNYAIRLFNFDKSRMKVFSLADALSFADLLSKSNHPALSDSQKEWAQEIVTMLSELYPEDRRVSYVTGSVLSTINNYRGKKLLNSTFEGVDVRERIFSRFKRELLSIPADPDNAFMTAQRKIYDHITDRYYSFSAPTSTGKSFIMRIFMKQQILEGKKNNFALIVPTKALINEVRIKVTEDLGTNLKKYGYHIVTAAGDAALQVEPKLPEECRNYILIMTPERLLYLLINEKKLHIDYLFIDEAHKVSSDDNRSPFYYQVVQMLAENSPNTHVVFASPNVPNPEIYLKLIGELDAESLKKQHLTTSLSPVTQIKFLIDLESSEVSVYDEHAEEPISITSVALPDADLTDVLLRFERDNDGNQTQSIVYFPSTRKTVTAARDFAANRVEQTDNKLLMELSKDICNEVHGDYYLAELVKKGVAYHIGYLPSSIRQRIENLFKSGNITALFCTSTLVEGVNLPADNLFVTDFRNGLKNMKPVDFRNLIGRVGRLDYSLYGNVFLVASNEKANEKYVSLLREKIPEQTLSVEKQLTKPQKKHVIETLLLGTVELAKYPEKQSADSYDMMRKFAIILLNDIMKNRNSNVRREFTALMKPGEEEQIRAAFSNQEFQQDDDITVSVDQSESLYQAIAFNGLEFPEIDADGKYDRDELMAFLERLCKIFKWEVYESDTLGHVGKYSHKHGKLSWYAVILGQWVQGYGLSQIMNQALQHKRNHPKDALYVDRTYIDYNDSREHRNIVISEVLSVIDDVILFRLSNYFLKVSKAYKEIKEVDQVENDWYEFVEYGSTNKQVISVQRHGFTRESAIYILKHPEYVANPEPELKLKRSIETCGNRGVCDDMDLVKYNLPDLFVD